MQLEPQVKLEADMREAAAFLQVNGQERLAQQAIKGRVIVTDHNDKMHIPDGAVELAPCPFCGGAAKLGCEERDDHDRAPRPHYRYIVECGECEVRIERESPHWWSSSVSPAENAEDAKTRAEAVTAWNRRAVPSPSEEAKPVAWSAEVIEALERGAIYVGAELEGEISPEFEKVARADLALFNRAIAALSPDAKDKRIAELEDDLRLACGQRDYAIKSNAVNWDRALIAEAQLSALTSKSGNAELVERLAYLVKPHSRHEGKVQVKAGCGEEFWDTIAALRLSALNKEEGE